MLFSNKVLTYAMALSLVAHAAVLAVVPARVDRNATEKERIQKVSLLGDIVERPAKKQISERQEVRPEKKAEPPKPRATPGKPVREDATSKRTVVRARTPERRKIENPVRKPSKPRPVKVPEKAETPPPRPEPEPELKPPKPVEPAYLPEPPKPVQPVEQPKPPEPIRPPDPPKPPEPPRIVEPPLQPEPARVEPVAPAVEKPAETITEPPAQDSRVETPSESAPAPVAPETVSKPDGGGSDPGHVRGSAVPAGPVDEDRKSDKDEWLKKYKRSVYGKIARSRRYPYAARKAGMEGRVVVRFTISSDGRLSGVSVVNPCEYSVLNSDAPDWIRRAAPFPAFPGEADKSSVTLTFALKYRITD